MLLERLKAKQREMGATDEVFADLLKVARPTWNKTRWGKKRIGESIMAATVRVFPELAPEVLFYLREEVPIGSASESKVTSN